MNYFSLFGQRGREAPDQPSPHPAGNISSFGKYHNHDATAGMQANPSSHYCHPSNSQPTPIMYDNSERVAREMIMPQLEQISNQLLNLGIAAGFQDGNGNLIQQDQARQIEELQNRNNHLLAKLDGVSAERDQAFHKMKQSEKMTQRLHQIIQTSGKNDTSPPDEEIVKSFRELNHLIMRLVHEHYSSVTRRLPEAKTVRSRTWKAFYDIFDGSTSAENKILWIRSLVALCLKEHFFNPENPMFGFDAKGVSENMEEGMVGFEKQLYKSQNGIRSYSTPMTLSWSSLANSYAEHVVTTADIVEWRSRTVAMTQRLGLRSRRRSAAMYRIQEELKKFDMHFSNSETTIIDAAISEICTKAVTLALLFRTNNTEYSWEHFFCDDVFDEEDMEVIGAQGKLRELNFVNTKIAFIVFGGVKKTTGPAEEDCVVLRKADVVVKAI
ncbi:MAG: hypothetical protein M1836_006837 [Candelina mexicana]|nr:MAG: hypothetical protein M1836_006837 [Candelina mexicana]